MTNKGTSEESTPNYYAFLLRLWREDEQSMWRASLEDPTNGDVERFGDLSRLLQFLLEHIGEPTDIV